jgi:cytochrome P450 / NADPH-cytochrome P450 reductase
MAFAMQEATLVLAMILQRFDLTLADPDYRLKVGETLTLKPVGLRIRARRRSGLPEDLPVGRPHRAAVPAPVHTPHAAGTRPVAAAGATAPLLILFGSHTGSSEAFARRIGGGTRLCSDRRRDGRLCGRPAG